ATSTEELGDRAVGHRSARRDLLDEAQHRLDVLLDGVRRLLFDITAHVRTPAPRWPPVYAVVDRSGVRRSRCSGHLATIWNALVAPRPVRVRMGKCVRMSQTRDGSWSRSVRRR